MQRCTLGACVELLVSADTEDKMRFILFQVTRFQSVDIKMKVSLLLTPEEEADHIL